MHFSVENIELHLKQTTEESKQLADFFINSHQKSMTEVREKGIYYA